MTPEDICFGLILALGAAIATALSIIAPPAVQHARAVLRKKAQ